MIKRINLIEKQPFSFTYLRLIQIGMIFVLFTAVLVGYEIFHTKLLEGKIKNANTVIKNLEEQRDQLMKKPVKEKVSVGEYQELLYRIEHVPSWSKLVLNVTRSLPNTLWLTNFKSVGGFSLSSDPASTKGKKNKSKSKKDKKNSKPETSNKTITTNYKLEISGLSSSMKHVTELSSTLTQTKHLKNIKAESQKQSYGYSFIIIGEIDTDVK